MQVYVVRGYHKVTNVSYIVGVYDTEEKAKIAVDNSIDADIDAFFKYLYDAFVVN